MSSINEIVKYSSNKVVLDSTALLVKSREFAVYATQLVKASVRHKKKYCMTETACKNLYKVAGSSNHTAREEASNACRLIEQLKGLGCLQIIPVGENGKGKHQETLDLISQSNGVVIFCRDRLLAETIKDRAEIYHVDRHGHAVPWAMAAERQAA